MTFFAITATVAGLAAAAPAGAQGIGSTQSAVVSDVPSTATPDITDGTVFAITRVGSKIVVGGSFTGVQNRGSSTTLPRDGLLVYNLRSGAVSTRFVPELDGTVESLLPGPTANTVYVGGYFDNVDGLRSKGVTLLSTTTGEVVAGFQPPALDGPVLTMARTGQHLIIGGGFTKVGASTKQGIASLDATTGGLDPFVDIQLAGHHNYDGTGAEGAVGARAIAINPAGTRMVVTGNFVTADRRPRDQIAMIDLDGATAEVDHNWATKKFTAACDRGSFDSYISDVQYAPSGSYFVVVTTGGAGTNTDGSKSLCDAASSWNSADSSTNVVPAWVDYTGSDSLLSVATTGTAIYVGGHQRWLNNPNAADNAGPGAVPRPGIAALDPLNGLPLAWDPGRNPRGAGAYAMYASSSGLYVGSDTDYFGDFYYKRAKLGFFPLAGGTAPASTIGHTLPGKLYLAGPLAGQSGLDSTHLAYRSVDGAAIGPTTELDTGPNWSNTRGAFVVGDTLFYGLTDDGTFYRASFDGSTVGTPTVVDPSHDPKWSSVQTGSGQTYDGVDSGYYNEIPNVTGAFYSTGRIFYTLRDQSSLYWRWFSPDSAIIGADEHTLTGFDLSTVAGMTVTGSTLYYAQTNGMLYRMSFLGQTLHPNTVKLVSGPAKDGLNWSTRSLFIYS